MKRAEYPVMLNCTGKALEVIWMHPEFNCVFSYCRVIGLTRKVTYDGKEWEVVV